MYKWYILLCDVIIQSVTKHRPCYRKFPLTRFQIGHIVHILLKGKGSMHFMITLYNIGLSKVVCSSLVFLIWYCYLKWSLCFSIFFSILKIKEGCSSHWQSCPWYSFAGMKSINIHLAQYIPDTFLPHSNFAFDFECDLLIHLVSYDCSCWFLKVFRIPHSFECTYILSIKI